MIHADNAFLAANGNSRDYLTRLLNAVELSKISGYTVETDPHRLILYWAAPPHTPDYKPWAMSDPDSIAYFIYSWLKNLPHEAWPEKPDLDGSCSRGWHLFVKDNRYARVEVTPLWMEHHK